MTIPLEAAKRGIDAGKALTGDIYTRRWTSEQGKGKKKRVVEHEVHVNPLVAVAAGVGAGVAVALGGFTLWATGKSFGRTASTTIVRRWVSNGKTVNTYTRAGVPLAVNVPVAAFFADSRRYLLKTAERRYTWTAVSSPAAVRDGKTTVWVTYTTTERGSYGIGERGDDTSTFQKLFDPLGVL